MILENLMSNYGSYNLWANKTLVSWVKNKPADVLTHEFPSSFSSIAKTFNHILDTEKFWLTVLKGAPKQEWYNTKGTSEEIIDALIQQSLNLSDYIVSLSEADLLQDCNLNAPWMQGTLPKYEYIQHCINHSSYHRGQIITIGRNIGVEDAPSTDYNYYNMIVKK